MNYYIVDSENVAISTVVENIDKLDNKKDKLILLYGDTRFQKVEPNAVDELLKYRNIYMVKAFVGSKNALDFQLCEHLGELIGKQGKKAFNNRFYIVSRDTGYDKMVERLKSRGYSIARISRIPDECVVACQEEKADEGANKGAEIDANILSEIIIQKYAISKVADITLLKMYKDMVGRQHPLVDYDAQKRSECGLASDCNLLNNEVKALGNSTHYSFIRAELRKMTTANSRVKALEKAKREHYGVLFNVVTLSKLLDGAVSKEAKEFIGATIYFAESIAAIKYTLEKFLPDYYDIDSESAKEILDKVCGDALKEMYNIDAKNFDYIDRDYNKEVWEYV